MNIIKNSIWILFSSFVFLVVAGKIFVWDMPNNRWLLLDIITKPKFDEKLTIAYPFVSLSGIVGKDVEVTDATKINSVVAKDFRQPTSTKEIVEIVDYARNNKKKISLSGARHSSAGQNLGDDIHLDMMRYDRILAFEKESGKESGGKNGRDRDYVTVESGVTWKQLQDYLGKQDKAVQVMQDSNIFSIGGSLGNNVHGKDIRYGSLIKSVKSFKIVLADGQEVEASREKNYDLFKDVIGGFGSLGIITEVSLYVDDNSKYEYFITHQTSKTLTEDFKRYEKENQADMIEGHFSISRNNLLNETQIYYFTDTNKVSQNTNIPKVKDDVSGENSIWLRKAVYRVSRLSEWGKDFRWWMQKTFSSSIDPNYVTRNTAMAAPFRTLELDDKANTDVLQEYFVPEAKVNIFLDKLRELVISEDVDLLNCVARKVNKDDEATISYATEDMYGFVCYYKIDRDPSMQTPNNKRFTSFTTKINDYLLEIDGKYYLAYNYFENKDQISKMYPGIKKILETKKRIDPEGVFRSKMIDRL